LQEAKQALVLKSEIEKTDQEIDRMVYEFYGLKEDEIRIVKGNRKHQFNKCKIYTFI
jgi:hypothetical protein